MSESAGEASGGSPSEQAAVVATSMSGEAGENSSSASINEAYGTENEAAPEEQPYLHYEEKMNEGEEDRYAEPEDIEDEFNESEEHENEEFDYEDFARDADEEAQSDYNGYDLKNFTDILDLEDSDVVERLDRMSAKAKELGLTQEQAEWVLQNDLESHAAESETQATPAEIKEYLNANLNRAEKKDYSAIGNFLKDRLAGTDSESEIGRAMENPHVYKFVRDLYKSTNRDEVVIKEKSRVPTAGIKTENAMDIYINKIKRGGNKTDIISEIISKAGDKEAVKKVFADYI